MKDIVVVGAGGFGRETVWMLQQLGTWTILGFYDDNINIGSLVSGIPVLGTVEDLNQQEHELSVAIAIAEPIARKRIFSLLRSKYISFPTLVHPTVTTHHPDTKFGRGCIITAGVIITTQVTLGDFVIVNLLSTIGHDCTISAFSSLMPQCSISGNVKIGECCFIGSGARVLQNLTLGANTVVGAGAVVTRSFDSNSKLAGIPAKLL